MAAQRGIVRPRLVVLVLLLVWSAVAWLALAQEFHLWPVQPAQAAPVPTATSARTTPQPVSSVLG